MKTIAFSENPYPNDICAYLWKNRNKYNLIKHNIVSVSRSGMNRKIELFVVYKNQIVNIGRSLQREKNLDFVHINSDGEFKIGGCGMDMAFALRANLYAGLQKIVNAQSKRKSKESVYNFDAVQHGSSL